MQETDWDAVLEVVEDRARRWLESLPDRPVYRPADAAAVRERLADTLTDEGVAAERVVAELADGVDDFLAAHASGRYFGFVIGGLLPAAWGADLLATTWDQNAGLHHVAPGAAVVEQIAGEWLVDLLDLPAESSVGFVTGGQMATFTCLAAARHEVLRRAGWDVEADGLQGAPTVAVVVKADTHSTVPRALRFLGLGADSGMPVACDDQSRIDPADLRRVLEEITGPTVVAVEAGNVNTGAFDDFAAVAAAAAAHRERGNPTWVHVDGAIGLWSRACPSHRHLADGLEALDSWSTDAHKLLNVPYDSGLAVCRHRAAHRAAMSTHASYLMHAEGDERDQMDFNPEFSRRARGTAVYAALRSLGRDGVARIVARTSRMAERFAERLAASGRAEIRNEVVLNQVLVRWLADDGDHDGLADRVINRIQADGTAFFSGTTWHDERLMRISVSDRATDTSDVDRAVEALLRCAEQA